MSGRTASHSTPRARSQSSFLPSLILSFVKWFFELTHTRLYCGFENAIEVFDITRPGYGTSDRVKTSFTRKERGGQKGLISALAFSAHYVGSYAAGSFVGSVVLYDEDTAGATGILEGVQGGGVTQLGYHPLDANVLFVASRRSDAIQAYDLRDTSQPLASLARPAGTNQRIAFDLDPWGRWIASGDEVSCLIFVQTDARTVLCAFGISRRRASTLSWKNSLLTVR